MMKRLILILILALGLRLYRLDYPLADWHSWRQADTSAVSRNFVKLGYDLLRPRFDDLSNVASGLPNPEGYRFVEFPFYNLLQAGFYRFFPFFSLEIWGRLVSILLSLLSLYFLYRIVAKYTSKTVGFWAAFFFAVLPFNIYYGRVILPEPMMVTSSLAMLFFLGNWIEGGEKWLGQGKINLFFGFLAAIIAFLLKPYTLVFLLPLAYLAWQNWQFNWSKWRSMIFIILASLLPFLWWRWWMSHFPEGIPAYEGLLNEGGIRLKGAFFYWLFAERIGKLILGYWGLVLFGLGLAVRRQKKEGLFFLSWLASIFIYFVIVASGNIRHDYYQIMAVPILCVFLAKGADFLLNAPRQFFSRLACCLLLVVCCVFMFAFSWYQVRDFFNINNPLIVEAGQAADRLLPKNALVIAPLGGDTAFLYQTKRRGWPMGISIEPMIEQGAQYYVNVNFGPESQWMIGSYCLLEKTDSWLIVDLTRKCEPK